MQFSGNASVLDCSLIVSFPLFGLCSDVENGFLLHRVGSIEIVSIKTFNTVDRSYFGRLIIKAYQKFNKDSMPYNFQTYKLFCIVHLAGDILGYLERGSCASNFTPTRR